MQPFDTPNHANVALDYSVIVSVSSSGSSMGFRGLYLNASSSLTITSRTGNEVFFNDVKPGVALWISGSHINVIHTAVTVIGLK